MSRLKTNLIMAFQFLALVSAFAGAANCLLSVPLLIQFHDAGDWPEVEAQVVQSRMERNKFREYGFCAYAKIAFRYEYLGRQKTEHRYGFRIFNCGFPALVRRDIERFPPGPVVARVDPETGRALLDPNLFALYFWPVVTIVAAYGLFLSTRWWKQE